MMNWKVIETCQASKFEKPFDREIAQFDTFVLAEDFINLVLPKETKDRLKLSQKTHLSESALYKRYKREHSIKDFYNNVDLISSKRRNHVPDTTDVITE